MESGVGESWKVGSNFEGERKSLGGVESCGVCRVVWREKLWIVHWGFFIFKEKRYRGSVSGALLRL